MNYFQPNDLNSALDVLKNNSDLTIAAGCTDLFPITNNMSLDKNILDITNIKSIRGFEFNNTETKIGSATTWTDIINENLPLKSIRFFLSSELFISMHNTHLFLSFDKSRLICSILHGAQSLLSLFSIS